MRFLVPVPACETDSEKKITAKAVRAETTLLGVFRSISVFDKIFHRKIHEKTTKQNVLKQALFFSFSPGNNKNSHGHGLTKVKHGFQEKLLELACKKSAKRNPAAAGYFCASHSLFEGRQIFARPERKSEGCL
ncbi:MAG: hypothetical protein ACE5HO_20345, partial [bacterium]